MRAVIQITSEQPINLPINYNYIMQGVVLRWLGDESYEKFIHDSGYEYNNRVYKLYTFSRLGGRFIIDKVKRMISFPEGAYLTVSSADNSFLNYLVNNIIKSDSFRIFKNNVQIGSVECKALKPIAPLKIRTLSPIVAYSTFENESTKKTYYYSPYEKEFSVMLQKNLIKKYGAINGREPKDCSFSISVTGTRQPRESVLIYKETVIKGWSGEFIIDGSEELLQIAYDAGLGSKNSQGFGCIDAI